MKWRWGPSEQLMDWVPWLLPLDPAKREVIMTRSGGLLRVARLEPPDFETASPESLDEHHKRLANCFARFGNGWSFWVDQWRTKAPGYFEPCDFGGCRAAQVIDDSRRRLFTEQEIFQNDVFLAVHLQPPAGALIDWATDRTGPRTQRFIDDFLAHSTALFGQMTRTFRVVDMLQGDQLASYLSASVTYDPGAVRFPSGFMARALATRQWQVGESGVTIDQRHLATVEVRNYGGPSLWTLDELHGAGFEYRWVTSFHGLNQENRRAEVKENRASWLRKQKGAAAAITEIFMKTEGYKDPDAARQLEALEVFEGELFWRPFALATCNVHVWGSSRAEADERASKVERLMRDVALEARTATLNAAFCLLADMPGAVGKEVANLRRSREDMRAITCVAPFTGISSGCAVDKRFGGAALMAGLTRHGGPFYWPLNQAGGDRAHTAVVGESGGGKSTLLAFMAAQFLRYQDASVIIFDRHRSSRVTVACLGGDWIELGGGGLGVQPLRAVHLPEERAWAHGWILWALKLQGLELRSHTDEAISDALDLVARCEPDERTLWRLHSSLSSDLKAGQALKAYLDGGSYGRTFDGVVASYGSKNVVGLETANLSGLGGVAQLLTSAVARAIKRDRLGGPAPKLVIIDESWSFDPAELNSYALELRKMQAALVLATQSLSHFDHAQAVWDQIGNKIFLPHAEALRPEALAQYKAKGLSDDQVEALAGAVPRGEYLLKTPDVTRLVSLRLTDEALRICGANGAAEQQRAAALIAAGVCPGEAFTRAWLGGRWPLREAA